MKTHLSTVYESKTTEVMLYIYTCIYGGHILAYSERNV